MENLPVYSRWFSKDPDDVARPGIEEGLPFVETRIGRLARYAKFFELDNDKAAAKAFRAALENALIEDGLDDETFSAVAEALIEYAPLESDMYGGEDA